MLYFSRWKVLAILAVVLAGVIFALPNVLPKSWQDVLGDYTGLRSIARGLDIQGGTSVLMEVDGKDLASTLISQQLGDVRAKLRDARIGYRLDRTANGLTAWIADEAEIDKAHDILRNLTPTVATGIIGSGAAKQIFNLERAGQQFTYSFDDEGLKARISQATEQALKVLGDRLNGFGIKDVSVQRQGLDRILIQMPGDEMTDEVKRALGLIGVLAFQVPCEKQPSGADDNPPEECTAFPTRQIPGQVLWVAAMTSDTLDGRDVEEASASVEPVTNEPIVNFKFNQRGTERFARLTRDSVGKSLAIILDQEVISAPRIIEPILGGSGQISGNFTIAEANNLAIALRSGALPAPISFISMTTNTQGP
ncbi:MAG: hypothetical protein AB7F09_17570 [Parvibaculaceae bacterium]